MNYDDARYQAAQAVAHAEAAETAANRLVSAVGSDAPPVIRDVASMLAVATAEVSDRARRAHARIVEEGTGR